MIMTSCRRLVFTDEKRFWMDGPDGYTKFLEDPRLSPDIFVERTRRGGVFMAWAAISWEGKNQASNFKQYI